MVAATTANPKTNSFIQALLFQTDFWNLFAFEISANNLECLNRPSKSVRQRISHQCGVCHSGDIGCNRSSSCSRYQNIYPQLKIQKRFILAKLDFEYDLTRLQSRYPSSMFEISMVSMKPFHVPNRPWSWINKISQTRLTQGLTQGIGSNFLYSWFQHHSLPIFGNEKKSHMKKVTPILIPGIQPTDMLSLITYQSNTTICPKVHVAI